MELVIRSSDTPLPYFRALNPENAFIRYCEFMTRVEGLALASGMSSPSATYQGFEKRINLGYELPSVRNLAWRLTQMFERAGLEGSSYAVLTDDLFWTILGLYQEFYPRASSGIFEPGAAGLAPIPWSLAEALVPCLGHLIELDLRGLLIDGSTANNQPTEPPVDATLLVDYTDTPPSR